MTPKFLGKWRFHIPTADFDFDVRYTYNSHDVLTLNGNVFDVYGAAVNVG